jgi:regulator of protease activity HflC (stomatin/prohibitin superfamily)
MGSEAADRGINTGVVIQQVRETRITLPEELIKSVQAERQHKRLYAPMLVTDAEGPHRIPFGLD